MSLAYSTTAAVGQEVATDVSTLLDAIRDTCVAASMTEMDGIFAVATLFNTVLEPSGQFIDIDGPGGSERYQFYTGAPPVGPIGVLAVVGDPLTSFQNLRDAINSSDANVFCTLAFFDPSPPVGQNGYGVVLRAQTRGTIGNQVTVVPQNANFAVVTDNSHMAGGGWRVLTGQTPQGLQARLLLTESSPDARTIAIQMASAREDFTTTAITPLNTAGLLYRFLAGKYNLALYQPGSSSANTTCVAQVPSLPDFLKGIRITAATNTSPVVITTASAHGLGTGDEIYISDCQDTVNITSGFATAPIVLTISPQPWVDDDVVEVSGTNAGSDADGIWAVTNAQAGTIDLLYSIGGAVINTGTVKGPRTSTNGLWTITVINATQFSLDLSDGTGSATYVASSGIMGKTNAYPKSISREMVLIGSSTAAANLRVRLYSSGNNAQQIVINAVNYGTSDDDGDPRFIIPAPGVLWTNGCAILTEPYVAAGPNGGSSPAVVIGQLWDAFLTTEDTPVDSTTTFDSHNWVEFGESASTIIGSLWMVEP